MGDASSLEETQKLFTILPEAIKKLFLNLFVLQRGKVKVRACLRL